MSIVIYGIGSPVVADVAETCARLRLSVAAWISNVDGPVFAPAEATVTAASAIPAALFDLAFLVPLFTPGHRHSALLQAQSKGFSSFATLIDPTAVVASSTAVGAGSYVNSLANIGAAGQVGNFVFVNRGASVGHHAAIDELVSLGPACVIAGGVRIGRGAVVGAGAIILPDLEIGANAVVGAGATVTRDVLPGTMVIGNPARVIRSEISGYQGVGV
jgi:hypothetical protein